MTFFKKLSIAGSISPVKNKDAEIIGLVIIVYNVTAQRQLEKQLQHVSTHDALIGLYNRARFEYEILRYEGETHVPVGLIVCDIRYEKLKLRK